ncbi:MAG: hypothetical protein KZQ83_06550 [gamma proteobacterium symbiont of Taylorina sp.]|nr:hypothetical protein [gamma proteobacterium symbiont of Taylorina sp.]
MAAYYVYRISPTIAKLVKPMELLNEFENYKQARNFAREYRIKEQDKNPAQESTDIFKVIFADNPLDAEEKLSEVREQPILKEWEK